MHLNHLAGLLPFFEPSIEWDDPMPTSQFRLERHTSRGLHTFVPLPSAPHPPTMVSHGGIPSHMIVNPEPNLRPFTTSRFPHGEEDHIPGSDNTTRNPVPIEGHTDPRPPGTSTGPEPPRATTRTTIPVPVRSKQRATSTEDPQPKKKQKSASGPINPPPALCLFPSSPSSHVMASTLMTRMMMQHPEPPQHTITQPTTSAEIPPYHPPSLPPHHQERQRHWVLTPNPTIRILQPTESSRPPSDPPYRPWSNADDQELINLKNDTKSRPSWKTIGARLRRDPQVRKLRWGILKQTDQHGHVHPPHEPEAED